MDKPQVGDEVVVFIQFGQRNERQASGRVVQVGRALVTIEYGTRSDKFRMDTGRINDNYGHSFYRTPEQVALREREARAIETLRENGLTVKPGRRLPLGQLEAIAAILEKANVQVKE